MIQRATERPKITHLVTKTLKYFRAQSATSDNYSALRHATDEKEGNSSRVSSIYKL